MSRSFLAWIFVWLVALAAGAVGYDWFLRHRDSPELIGRALLHKINLSAAGIVLIETAHGQVTLRRTVWGWEVEEQFGFVADAAKLRALLLQLAGARIAQRVPVARDRLGDLGLLQKIENDWRFEAGRTASVLSIIHGLDQKHKLMYQVLIGHRRPGLGTYVRFPDDRRVYLVAEEIALEGDAAQWIRRRVFEEDASASMRRIDIHARGGPALTLARPNTAAPWRPAQGALAEERVHDVVRTLAELRVARVGEPLPPEAPRAARHPAPADLVRIQVHFFDQHAVTLDVRETPARDGHRPARLAADLAGAEGGDTARWRVEVFNRHYGGRLVELDAEQSRRLLDGKPALAPAR